MPTGSLLPTSWKRCGTLLRTSCLEEVHCFLMGPSSLMPCISVYLFALFPALTAFVQIDDLQVSGMSTKEYFQTRIFNKVGMKDTVFDLSGGNDGVYSGLLRPPGYVSYLSPLSLSVPALDFDVIGNLNLKGESGACRFRMCT